MPKHGLNTAVVRAASIEDTALLRGLRLLALSDAPGAFLSRYEDFVDLGEAQWRTLVADWTSEPHNAAFVATDNNIGIGMCGAFVEADERVKLVAMWVAPSARGTTIASQLLELVFNFARGLGADVVEAWVVEDNHQAIRFYEKHLFRHNDSRQPYEPAPAKDELMMVRRL